MKAADIECPACKAGKGEKCRDVGYGDEARTKTGHHVSRVRRAHYMTIGDRKAKTAANKAMKKGVQVR